MSLAEETWGDLQNDPAFRDTDAGPSDLGGSSVELDEDQSALDLESLGETSFTLRGMGEQPDSCGAYFPMNFCEECGTPHFRESHCEMRDCPQCWRGNVARSTESLTARLCGLRHSQDSAQDKRTVHAVVSPPEDVVRTVTDVYDGFRTAYDLAEAHGIRGGVAIFHGYRPTEAAKDQFRDEDPEFGIWEWIREHQKNWRVLSEWSPHWHIVGLARDFGSADPDQDDGWMVWRIRSLKPFRMSETVDGDDAYSDAAGLFRYILSHASHETGKSKDVVRWFGAGATACFSMNDLAVSSKQQIESKAHKAVYGGDDEGIDDGESSCDEDDCDGDLRPIWEAFRALQDRQFCEQIGGEAQRELEAAAEWMMGDLDPPPGLKNPRTEQQAREALAAIKR